MCIICNSVPFASLLLFLFCACTFDAFGISGYINLVKACNFLTDNAIFVVVVVGRE